MRNVFGVACLVAAAWLYLSQSGSGPAPDGEMARYFSTMQQLYGEAYAEAADKADSFSSESAAATFLADKFRESRAAAGEEASRREADIYKDGWTPEKARELWQQRADELREMR